MNSWLPYVLKGTCRIPSNFGSSSHFPIKIGIPSAPFHDFHTRLISKSKNTKSFVSVAVCKHKMHIVIKVLCHFSELLPFSLPLAPSLQHGPIQFQYRVSHLSLLLPCLQLTCTFQYLPSRVYQLFSYIKQPREIFGSSVKIITFIAVICKESKKVEVSPEENFCSVSPINEMFSRQKEALYSRESSL